MQTVKNASGESPMGVAIRFKHDLIAEYGRLFSMQRSIYIYLRRGAMGRKR